MKINKDMKNFALWVNDECTKRGYSASICLADGMGCGEFYHNIEDVDYSMFRFIEKNGKTAFHFKSYMQSNPENTNKSLNALIVLSDMMGMNTLTFMESVKEIEKRIEVEREESKIMPFEKK